MNMFDRINLRVDIYVYIELKVPYFDAADWVYVLEGNCTKSQLSVIYN